ncbi:MAG: flagellar biosynthesis protein FlhB [Rhodospirillaceae bacterium]
MSEDEDDSSKTEEPSGRKLEKAHEEGQFVISREVNHLLAMIGILIIIVWIAPPVVSGIKDELARFLTEAHQLPTDAEGIRLVIGRSMLDVVYYTGLPLLLLMVLGILATVLQIGFNLTWASLKIDLAKLNPIAGLQRMFKLDRQAIEMGKNLGKLIAIGLVVYLVLKPVVVGFEHFIGMDFSSLLWEIHSVSYKMMVAIILVVLVITVIDFAYQHFTFMKKMRMTKQEVKDEYKQTEGDPLVKSKIRAMRVQRARQRMMSAVPQADVVITNPTHFAVAMKYDPASGRAPVVVAKGADFVAATIRKVAETHDIPVVRNPPLARALYDTVDIDQEIPTEHYRAVAEVITFVYKLKGRTLNG